MFQSPYQRGIAACKAGKGKHENPYNRDRTWFEKYLCDYTPEDLRRNKTYWEQGWEAENAAQSAKVKSV